MNKRYRLLDLFCGAGGAAMGYYRAGFEVVGVDIREQHHYPFQFYHTDALEYCNEYGRKFDVIHASPPCQRFSVMTKRWNRQGEFPDLIVATRTALLQSFRPYVIENVRGSGLYAVLMLCGSMFGIPIHRHRYFEMSNPILLTPSCRHDIRPVRVYGHTGGSSTRDNFTFGTIDDWKSAMEIDWMTSDELAEAIPPAYTEFIGRHLMQVLTGAQP